jgi:hypothetical protein
MSDEEMAPFMEERAVIGAPLYLTLRVEVRLHLYEGPATLERLVNGHSGGVTPLYQPGNVLCDGSENLKPLCKVRAVDFVYQGRGLYLDEHETSRPFYENHAVEKLIQLSPGQVVFQKPFAGRASNVRLETQFKRQDRDEWTEVVGLGRDTYPLYPYGGYVPPHGDLREMEQAYCFPGADRSGGKDVTALKLYRSSFFHTSGGFPPTPFSHERHLTFALKDEFGEVFTYTSYGYDQPGGSLKYLQVHCAKTGAV